MDIISFFRDIDGPLYYVMAVINTILIFAIIGYLGEKNNEKIIKMGMQTAAPNLNGAINLSTITSEKHSQVSIPTVAPTMVSNPQPIDNINQGMIPKVNNQGGYSDINQNINNQQGMFVNNSVSNAVEDIPQQIITPEQNEIDPNEKAPAVLVINSDNTNIPK